MANDESIDIGLNPAMPRSEASVLVLPDRRALHGPVTRRRLARLALLWLALIVFGALLAALAPQGGIGAFGLGLVAPGAGFLLHAELHGHGLVHLVLFAGSMAAFAAALGLWFGTGNILAPPAVWLLTALAAISMDGPPTWPGARWVVPALAFAGLGATAAGVFLRAKLAQGTRRATNNFLAGARFEPALRSGSGLPELNDEDVERLRFLFDRALQPVADFNGFDHRDQFQTGALRYQMNALSFALAMAQARFTPALAGPFTQAQNRLVQKQCELRNWTYWRLENLWGNLDGNRDPCVRENIMYTGFIALQMAMARAASPARGGLDLTLRLHHPGGENFTHDYSDLARTTASEMARSPFGLMACEPNWIYPLCNTMGASALRAHDRDFDGALWRDLAGRFEAGLEAEFIDASGRFVACRSARSGLGFPMLGGIMPQAMPCYFLNAVLPEIAARQYVLVRRRIWRDGRLDRSAFWPIDTGNYGFSRASAYAATALAAVEMGDDVIADACFEALEAECPSVLLEGARHRQGASVWALGIECLARCGTHNGFRQLVTVPLAGQRPYIQALAYPDAICHAAYWEGQGTGEELVAILAPGDRGGRIDVGFGGLRPGAAYRIGGAGAARLVADARGEARYELQLDRKLEVRLQQE